MTYLISLALAVLCLLPASALANPRDIYDCVDDAKKIEVAIGTDSEGNAHDVRVTLNGQDVDGTFGQFKNFGDDLFALFYLPAGADGAVSGYVLKGKRSAGSGDFKAQLTPFTQASSTREKIFGPSIGVNCSDD